MNGYHGLTLRQEEILTYISESIAQGYGFPTYQNIMDKFGFTSNNAVTTTLKALSNKGFIERKAEGWKRNSSTILIKSNGWYWVFDENKKLSCLHFTKGQA